MSQAVGADVASICRKCGDAWHVIVASVDGKIAKVQCKGCGGTHRFRAPPGASEAKPAKATRKKAVSKASKSKTRVKKVIVEADMTRPIRAYSMRETYTTGDRIEHPKFGEGVVETTASPIKIEVHFAEGSRTLIHARD